MIQEDLIGAFSDGVKTTYGWYAQGQEPKRPYRVLNYLQSEGMDADNFRYFPVDRWQLDLVTDFRDIELEKSTESTLQERGISFSKTQEPDAADHRIRMIYRFNTIGE